MDIAAQSPDTELWMTGISCMTHGIAGAECEVLPWSWQFPYRALAAKYPENWFCGLMLGVVLSKCCLCLAFSTSLSAIS